jgi:hypothetical protein
MTPIKTLLLSSVVIPLLCASCATVDRSPKLEPKNDPNTEPPAKLTISGSTGLPYTAITGFPEPVSTDQSGEYEVFVRGPWTGTVRPVKAGVSFTPGSRHYSRVAENQEKQDFQARIHQYKLSGSVGMEGVLMQGLPGNPTTGSDGCYEAMVEYGWSGMVKPAKEGFRFQPQKKHYVQVSETQIHEDYQGSPLPPQTVDINGRIVIDGTGIEGVKMLASKPVDSAVTDEEGYYGIQVPYGWSGRLTPQKAGFQFAPPFLSYRNLTENVDLPNTILSQPKAAQPADTAPAESATVAQVEPQQAVDDDLQSWPDIVRVQDGAISVDQTLELEQDLLTMSLILDEAVHGARLVEPLLNQDVKAMHIADYGIIFLLRVDYPLASQKNSSPEDKAPDNTDDVWMQAQQRLRRSQYTSRAIDKLSTAKTSQLQAKLIKTLQHAANIRHLSPQDQIIVSISGSPGDQARPVHMTVRANVEQINRLFSGELDINAFAERVKAHVY